jgi:hypothetical protein
VSGYKCGVLYDPQSWRGLVVCTSLTRTEETAELARRMLAVLQMTREV